LGNPQDRGYVSGRGDLLMLRRILIILLLSFSLAQAQEILPGKDYKEDAIVLNEELRKLRNNVSGNFIDRGDPSAVDYEETGSKAVLNTDGNWHDLNLSTIVSDGAKKILLWVRVEDNVAASAFNVRKNGNTNSYNSDTISTQVANVSNYGTLIVDCDTNRVIEYNGTNVAFVNISIVVRGWWK
jgi:hypothetical protein